MRSRGQTSGVFRGRTRGSGRLWPEVLRGARPKQWAESDSQSQLRTSIGATGALFDATGARFGGPNPAGQGFGRPTSCFGPVSPPAPNTYSNTTSPQRAPVATADDLAHRPPSPTCALASAAPCVCNGGLLQWVGRKSQWVDRQHGSSKGLVKKKNDSKNRLLTDRLTAHAVPENPRSGTRTPPRPPGRRFSDSPQRAMQSPILIQSQTGQGTFFFPKPMLMSNMSELAWFTVLVHVTKVESKTN